MKYFAYCRKSQESEDRQIMSLDSQETELVHLAERDGLDIKRVYRESMTAKAPGRPLFDEMLASIQDGTAHGILCWKLDRLARNPVDGGRIIWLLQKGVIQEIRTPERVYLPTDNVLLMYVELSMANQYIRDLRANVMRGNKTKLEKGGWPGMAPLGYLNDKATRTIVVDADRAGYVRKAFELYATGGYSLLEIANILFKEGFRTRSGKKVSRSNIHEMIRNPFPTGAMEKHGIRYQGNHEPIVPKELYDAANAVLAGNMRPKKKVHAFHLRGFLKCASCGCMLTATKKKGHDYYYCTNGKGNCEEHKKYLRSEKVDVLVAEAFAKLQSDPELVELAYEAAKVEAHADGRYFETALASLQNALQENRSKQSRFADSYGAEITPEAIYAEKMRALRNDEVSILAQIKHLETENRNRVPTLEPIKKVFLQGISAQNDYLNAKPEAKRVLVEELLWNLSIKDQKVADYLFKPAYQELATLPHTATYQEVCAGQDSNLRSP